MPETAPAIAIAIAKDELGWGISAFIKAKEYKPKHLSCCKLRNIILGYSQSRALGSVLCYAMS